MPLEVQIQGRNRCAGASLELTTAKRFQWSPLSCESATTIFSGPVPPMPWLNATITCVGLASSTTGCGLDCELAEHRSSPAIGHPVTRVPMVTGVLGMSPLEQELNFWIMRAEPEM